MLEGHTADFLETWTFPGHDFYGERGAEPIYKIFRFLQSTYWSMQPATIRLQSKLKEHYRLVHLEANALKPVILKRK